MISKRDRAIDALIWDGATAVDLGDLNGIGFASATLYKYDSIEVDTSFNRVLRSPKASKRWKHIQCFKLYHELQRERIGL
jgi:hypothetical protein